MDVIVRSISEALEQVSPELFNDLLVRGILLTGGGSLVTRLDQRITMETGLAVRRPDDPLRCMARGVSLLLTEPDLLRSIARQSN
jgi:rod shape-determining protein MreB